MKLIITLLTTLLFTPFVFANEIALKPLSTAVEICDNRIDDDGDGLIDCMDPDCNGSETCWDCEVEFYQVHSNSYIVKLDPRTGTYSTIGTIVGASQINGCQFNPIDGHVYAPCIIDGQHKLGMLLQSGEVKDIGVDLPGSAIFYVGAIDNKGVMYTSNGGGIYSMNLNAETIEPKSLGISNPGVADFAYDLRRDLFYGVTGKAQLKVLYPNSLEVKTYDIAGSINGDTGGFGAAWSSNDGSFFVYNNSSGKIYSVNVDDLTSTLILNGTGNLSINDGFNCILADPPFETKCNNGRDDDGDGLADCDDPDCYGSNVCLVEICDNGIDDDGDGWADCNDSECFYLEACIEICGNGIDDNNNGLIDGDDPQCGVSSGITGGLESNRRLSDKISLRNYNTRIINPDDYNTKQDGLIPFTIKDFKSNHTLESFIPTDVLNAYVAHSTPEDLVEITNATEVAAADYYVADQRVASVLGVKSENGVYEHSKQICDRLDGSRLLDISYLFAKGGNFISYELVSKEGRKEYAVSFSASFVENEEITIESYWNLRRFESKEKYYNFQIWANTYEQLIVLLESVLEKLQDAKGIQTFETNTIPQAFVQYGAYKNGRLKLLVKNKDRSENLTFNASVRRHETAELENIKIEIKLTGRPEEVIYLNTGNIYDMGASLQFDGNYVDEIFMADGAWGYDDQSSQATVEEFHTYPDDRTAKDDAYMVERSISIDAQVKDYLNIYRGLSSKLQAKSLVQYNTLSFDAVGEGKLEITIVKESITDWTNQYRITIELPDSKSKVNLNLNKFLSQLDETLVLDDATMIVFTLLGDNKGYVSKSMKLNDVEFRNQKFEVMTNPDIINHELVYPNPVVDVAKLTVKLPTQGSYQINIIDQLGKQIMTKSTNGIKGQNNQELNLRELLPGTYYYQVIHNDGMLGSGKFIKI